MKVYNNNQLYKSPAGDQLWNSGRQNWIFGRIGDQEGAISDPAYSVFSFKWPCSGRVNSLQPKNIWNTEIMKWKHRFFQHPR